MGTGPGNPSGGVYIEKGRTVQRNGEESAKEAGGGDKVKEEDEELEVTARSGCMRDMACDHCPRRRHERM